MEEDSTCSDGILATGSAQAFSDIEARVKQMMKYRKTEEELIEVYQVLDQLTIKFMSARAAESSVQQTDTDGRAKGMLSQPEIVKKGIIKDRRKRKGGSPKKRRRGSGWNWD